MTLHSKTLPNSVVPSKPQSQKSVQWISLLQACSWLGSLGVLSGGFALAETPGDFSAPAQDIPSAVDLFEAPAAPAPVELAPRAVEAPIPEFSAPEPSVEFSTGGSVSDPVAPAPLVTSPTPAAPIAEEAPSEPVSQVAQDLAPRLEVNLGELNQNLDAFFAEPGRRGRFDQGSSVFLAERLTGCEAVLQPGQSVPRYRCAALPSQQTLASLPSAHREWPQPRSATAATTSPNAFQGAALNFIHQVAGRTSTAGRDYYNKLVAGNLKYQPRGGTNYIFPLSVPAVITSVFGWRIHPISGDHRFHQGTDIGAPLGTPVLAAYAGQVAVSEFLSGYGFTVILQHHDATEETLYAHLSQLLVEPGEWVEQGEVIGLLGSTGNSTGPHLHFELHQLNESGWVVLDPTGLLEYTLAQFIKALQTAQTEGQPVDAG